MFWNHYYLGRDYAEGNGSDGRPFVHYPREQWFQPGESGEWSYGKPVRMKRRIRLPVKGAAAGNRAIERRASCMRSHRFSAARGLRSRY